MSTASIKIIFKKSISRNSVSENVHDKFFADITATSKLIHLYE